ncbi:MAG: hypothetical protein ACTS6A_01595, partial [Candidatus Hodgkinia cicadicola]
RTVPTTKFMIALARKSLMTSFNGKAVTLIELLACVVVQVKKNPLLPSIGFNVNTFFHNQVTLRYNVLSNVPTRLKTNLVQF